MAQKHSGRFGKITSVSAQGIVEWHNLLEKYPAEMAHDFRRFFGYSIFDVGRKVHWTEAMLHLQILKRTPESLLQVELSDGAITRPWTWSEVPAYELLDLTAAAHIGKKAKPFVRPWASGKKLLGKASITLKQGAELFARFGHKPSLD